MDKVRVLFLCVAWLVAWTCLSAQSQDWHWISRSNGAGPEHVTALATDSWGNTYVGGYFNTSAILGSITLTTSETSMFVAKLDPSGNWLWARQAGDTSFSSYCNALAVDSAGNVFIAGNFSGTAVFGTTTHVSAGQADIFLAKLDTHGNWIWSQSAGTGDNEICNALALDDEANVYITGYAGTVIYVSKFTSGGIHVVTLLSGGTGSGVGRGIVVDAYGNIYITGNFSGSVVFSATTLTSAGGHDMFIIKLTPSGTLEWARRAGGIGNEFARGIALDGVSTVYATGNFDGTTNIGGIVFTSNGTDGFVAKLSNTGTWQGAAQIGGSGTQFPYSICVENSNAIYVTGVFTDTGVWGSYSLVSAGFQDIFVAKMNSTGTWLWAKRAGGVQYDEGRAIALDANGDLRVGGYFMSNAAFGSLTLTGISTLISDLFVAKIGDLIPRPPDNLSITRSAGNAVLAWDPVTETIFGQAMIPDHYKVYRNSLDATSPYTYLGSTGATNYTH
ncbi:MAG: SBBP repeat-containing protein [Candidatus Syntrophosphaera sp.]|nr:SBBP repeat-containing protein [Candidatus Syntrophosphaera sp.]